MTDDIVINQDETIDNYGNLKVIQKTYGFRFSMDAVVLANFATIKKNDKVIDLGTGNGIISLLIAPKAKHITAIEIQPEMIDLAKRNVILNRLSDKIEIIEGDIRLVKEIFSPNQYDLVVTNPPYRVLGSGRVNPNDLKALARHEIKCTLDDVLKAGSYLLKDKGRLAIVHRPDRLVDLMIGCRQRKLEPKRLQFVHIDKGEAELILVEAIKNGKPDLTVLSPIAIEVKTN
ncbi:MAG: tRNA1(Val) (adenine(37)-N6)-methyltransferase [Candidatus Poribacteria bacterium]